MSCTPASKGNNMRASWQTTAVTAALAAAALLSACSGDGGFDDASPGAGESSGEGDDVLGQTEQAWCANPDGTNSVMAALAVATAKELRRWEPLTDFYVSNNELRLTSTGRSRCSDGMCLNTQALLDMQKSVSEGQVKVSPTVTLSASALRSRLVAKFGEQAVCESRPDNHNGSDCPAEDHQLRFLFASKGSCDTDFWFEATKATGGPLQYPAQLKNKLLWVDTQNPYVNFQSTGNMVSIDPTLGLNEDNTGTAGSCTPLCTRISGLSLAGRAARVTDSRSSNARSSTPSSISAGSPSIH